MKRLDPGEEICAKCGKVITKRAHKNLWRGTVVCSSCLSLLKREADWASRRGEAPTDLQVSFAVDLGITIPAGATRGEVSDAIDRVKKRRDDSDRRRMLRAWAYSVARHMTGSRWVRWGDSGIPIRAMDAVVREFRAHRQVVDYIEDTDYGEEPDWVADLVCDRGGDWDDNWYWFDLPPDDEAMPGIDYPESACDAFRITAGILDARLGSQLAKAPKIILPRPRDRIHDSYLDGLTRTGDAPLEGKGAYGCGCLAVLVIVTAVIIALATAVTLLNSASS